jgi:hypothetical protein
MYSSQRSASSEAPQCYDWAPQLLRFFQLLIGDQTAAERLTIDTVVEGAALAGVRLANGMSSALVHCAVMKASSATESTAPLEDKLVRAVKSLPFSQRLVVVLFRGLGLPLERLRHSQVSVSAKPDAFAPMVFLQSMIPWLGSKQNIIR